MPKLLWVAPFLLVALSLRAESTNIEDLRREIADLRNRMDSSGAAIPVTTSVDWACDCKCGQNTDVKTKNGKLRIGGLVQVWYETFRHDNRGLFDDQTVNTVFDSNAAQDTSSFRVRRAQLNFTVDITENVSSYVMIDPAREASSFPLVTFNQANTAIFKTANQVAPEFNNANGPGIGSTASIANLQSGGGTPNTLLQDAYINYHCVVPHHDFQVGQFRPWLGLEGLRDDGELDFVERSFAGLLTEYRDLGASVHGTWFDDRLQYWAGVFDGAGNYFLTSGQFQNRADDNNSKDVNGRITIRPLPWWNNCGCENNRWGNLEIGASGEFGKHGGSGGVDPINAPINGLNRKRVAALREDVFLEYHAGGHLKGFWLKGEYLRVKDRFAPGTISDLQAGSGTDIGNTGSGSGMAVSDNRPQVVRGYYASVGYKLSDSVFSDCACSSWYNPLEFAFRFDNFENIIVSDLDPGDPHEDGQTDVSKTKVYTGGVNYYIKGNKAKIQLNYNAVRIGDSFRGAQFHKVNADSLVLSFQVAF